MPYPDFETSASVLDWRRLGKQRIECFQIRQALANPKHRYRNHPAVLMWRGYEDALDAYYAAVCREWIRRGYKHTMPVIVPRADYERPPWLDDARLHGSHQLNLWRKWQGLKPVEYFWPSKCAEYARCQAAD